MPAVTAWRTVGGWVDPFLAAGGLGVARPSVAGVGAGVYQGRAWPTTTADARPGVTYDSASKTFTVASGYTVEDVVFPGFVNVGVATVRNWVCTGPDTEQAVSRSLMIPPTSGSARATIEFGTFDPSPASAYYDALQTVNVNARRLDIKNCVDGFRGHTYGLNLPLNSLIESSWVHDLVQFSPDYASGRAETHNDCAQMQGSTVAGLTATDLVFDGCEFDGRHSLTKGTLPPYRLNISALMLTPNVGQIHMTYRNGWLLGGTVCVNVTSTLTGSELALTNVRMERPGTAGDGRAPDAAIGKSSSTVLTLTMSNVTYLDNGAAVSVTTL